MLVEYRIYFKKYKKQKEEKVSIEHVRNNMTYIELNT